MYKPKSIGSLTSGQVWDAHVAKAASSPIHAREYKKSNYVLDTDKVMGDRIRTGEPVGQNYLSGKQKKRLLKYGNVTEEDFAKYTK